MGLTIGRDLSRAPSHMAPALYRRLGRFDSSSRIVTAIVLCNSEQHQSAERLEPILLSMDRPRLNEIGDVLTLKRRHTLAGRCGNGRERSGASSEFLERGLSESIALK